MSRAADRADGDIIAGFTLAELFDPERALAVRSLRSPELVNAARAFKRESSPFDDGKQITFLKELVPGAPIENAREFIRKHDSKISGRGGGLHRLPGFIPDFSDPSAFVREFQTAHTLLSKRADNGEYAFDITVRVYRGTLNRQSILWYFCNDQQERIWIDRIELEGGALTTFLTQAEVIDSGILTNKPLEYSRYAQGLVRFGGAEEFESDGVAKGSYVDISKFLSWMLPVKQYSEWHFPKPPSPIPEWRLAAARAAAAVEGAAAVEDVRDREGAEELELAAAATNAHEAAESGGRDEAGFVTPPVHELTREELEKLETSPRHMKPIDSPNRRGTDLTH